VTGPQSTQPKRRRLSLSKAQRETAAGIELLSLCEAVTEDGRISDDEIGLLRGWADHHADCDLPAHEYIAATITKVLADGVISDFERAEVYAAIETVLPPDLRRVARSRRRDAEAADDKERRRDDPLDYFDFMVAGVGHEGRSRTIAAHVHPRDVAFLVRDAGNMYSRNAVQVVIGTGESIGWVPERDVEPIAHALDRGAKVRAHIKKVLADGRYPIPVIVGELYGAEATLEIPETPVLVKRRPTKETDSSIGLIVVLGFVGLIVVSLLALMSSR